MATVSEQLEAENRRRLLAMTPAERLAEALALGRAAVRAYAAAHGVSLTEARRHLERAAQAGRRPSRVARDIIE